MNHVYTVVLGHLHALLIGLPVAVPLLYLLTHPVLGGLSDGGGTVCLSQSGAD